MEELARMEEGLQRKAEDEAAMHAKVASDDLEGLCTQVNRIRETK
jgi:hypothetical protein